MRWIPFSQYSQASVAAGALKDIVGALAPGAVAIVAGPAHFGQSATDAGVFVEARIALTETPGVAILRMVLPNVRVRPDVFLYLLRKTRP